MTTRSRISDVNPLLRSLLVSCLAFLADASAEPLPTRPAIDDTASGFRDLTAADFVKVNSADDT